MTFRIADSFIAISIAWLLVTALGCGPSWEIVRQDDDADTYGFADLLVAERAQGWAVTSPAVWRIQDGRDSWSKVAIPIAAIDS